MFAENLLDLLTRKNFITSELAGDLRERIAPMPRAIPADVFAKRLVDQGIITQTLADSLLQQLQSPTPTPPTPPPLPPNRPSTPPPLPPGRPSLSANSAPQTSVPPLLRTPTPSVSQTTDLFITESFPLAQDLPPSQDRFRKKSFSIKKKVKNPWDTKLILFGGTGLLLLVFASLFLFSSLVRRNAEGMFDKANQSFQNGDASQAIVGFSEYLTAFPNHSAASTARIRLALARIRLVVDVKSDWIKACNTAIEEIEPVRNEPAFFDESKAELAVLLPKIAVGLSTEAESKLAPEYARRSAEMLELIDSLIPPSLRPVEQMADARTRNENVWKRLNRDKSLSETQQNLEGLLKKDSPDHASVEQSYQFVDTLLRDYPELENDPRLLELLRNISIFEVRAIRTLTPEQVPQGSVPDALPPSPSYEIASLYFQDRKQTSSDNTAPSHILLAAKNMLFALRSDTGVPVWKTQLLRPLPQNSGAWHIGPPVWAKHPSRPKSSSLQIIPIPRPNPDSAEFALLVEPEQGQIDQVDAASGTILCRWSLDEAIFVSEPVLPPGKAEVVFAVTTQSGKLIVFSLDLSDKGTMPSTIACQLPQRINSAPVVDSTGNQVFQFANRQTLYTIPSVRAGEYRSEFVGHKPSSIRIPPIIMDAQVLLVCQTGSDACELVVCVPGETPDTAAKQSPLQTLSISGLVDTPIATDANYCALATDRGEVFLYEKLKEEHQPLRQVARGSGGDLRNHRSVRYITLSGKNIWVADRQLMKFATQLSQGRLLPGNAVKKDIETWIRPFSQNGTLYHTFQRPGRGGVSVEAISLRDDSVRWETEIAAPIVMEPHSISDSDLLLYTDGGRAYRINEKMVSSQMEGGTANTSFDGTPVIAMPPDSFAGISLGSVIPLENGLNAWVPRIERAADHSLPPSKDNRLFFIYDSTLSEATRFRSLLLPSSPATMPVSLGGNLLIPLNDGRVLLTNPRSGESVVPAFTPPRDTMETALWGPPTATANQDGFLIVDNRADKEKQYIMYQVALEGEGKETKFVSKERIILEHPVLAPIAIFGNEFILIDVQDNVLTVRTPSVAGEPLTKNSVHKLKDRLVWGPYSVEGAVLWATADSNLHALYSDGTIVSVASPIPIGQVLQNGNHLILNSSTGILWKLELDGLKSVYSLDTGTRPAVGPTRLDSRILIACENGSMYAFEEPL